MFQRMDGLFESARPAPEGRRAEGFRLRWMLALSMLLVVAAPAGLAAQERGSRPSGIDLTVEVAKSIRDFYAARPEIHAEALPPGIRKRLERGKPLPPGIAKQVAPAELRSRVHLPDGYQLVEVGVDVLLVEVATNVVHDVLMDVIR